MLWCSFGHHEAAIAVANADKETRIQKAAADQDAQKAEALAATQVANAQKEKAISLAHYEQDWLLQPKPKHKLTKLKPLLTKLMPFKKRFLKKKQPKQKCRLN